MAEIKQKISSNKFNESVSVDISGSAVAANERLKCSDEQCKKVSEECQVHKVLVDKKPPVPIKRKKNVPVTEKSSVEVDAESPSARNTVTMNKRLKVDDKVVTSKPPLPPKPDKLTSAKIAPKTDKVKRKAEENRATLVAKLNAYAEQLRLEVADLKASLITERSAVRALR